MRPTGPAAAEGTPERTPLSAPRSTEAIASLVARRRDLAQRADLHLAVLEYAGYADALADVACEPQPARGIDDVH